jgi:BirA family biotin operon repressor/biotin-[acetyl-CoA-carboxylase] ligase
MKLRVLFYDRLDSTNNLARKMAEEGACEGTVVVANYQTGGRGRFKRRWVSRAGENLLFTIILRPKLKAGEAGIITHVAAATIQMVLRDELGLAVKLKRPNDVLVGKKKIAGILTESKGEREKLDYLVVGVGLNVNSRKTSIPKRATSVWLECGKKENLRVLLDKILEIFIKKYSALCN